MIRLSVCGVHIKEGSLFLAKRKPGGTQGGRWEFPGGKVEDSESPQDALKREFQEELGVDIQVGELLGETFFTHKGQEYRLLAFQITLESEHFLHREHDEAGWYTLEQVKHMDLSESDAAIAAALE